MGLNQRLDILERRLNPAQRIEFEVCVPPPGLSRAEHRVWQDRIERTAEGLVFSIDLDTGGVHEDALDAASETT